MNAPNTPALAGVILASRQKLAFVRDEKKKSPKQRGAVQGFSL
jgi:hypothetical protein